jgi:hypothetical protein
MLPILLGPDYYQQNSKNIKLKVALIVFLKYLKLSKINNER